VIDEECLATLDVSEFTECFFLPGIKVDKPDAQVPSTEQIIEIFRKHEIRVERKGPMPVAAPSSAAAATNGQAPSAPTSSGDFAVIREGLKVALMRQIGPVGGKILTKIMEQTWKGSAAPTREELMKLIDLLKNEIDDEANRKEFLSEVGKLLVYAKQSPSRERATP
jgi:hypothetical protein